LIGKRIQRVLHILYSIKGYEIPYASFRRVYCHMILFNRPPGIRSIYLSHPNVIFVASFPIRPDRAGVAPDFDPYNSLRYRCFSLFPDSSFKIRHAFPHFCDIWSKSV
jgi:hypothetical protein